MLWHVIAHEGCTDTVNVKESALKVDWEKIPCCTRESNLPQQCAGQTLYRVSYIPPTFRSWSQRGGVCDTCELGHLSPLFAASPPDYY